MPNTNRVNGHATGVAEHVRETRDHLVGAAESATETVKTFGDQVMNSAKEYHKEYRAKAVKFTKEKPIAALGISMLAGFILGLIARR